MMSGFVDCGPFAGCDTAIPKIKLSFLIPLSFVMRICKVPFVKAGQNGILLSFQV
jgi:hypothetical protein